MRQIVLDTETTGIDPEQGHRIVEIGAIELVNREPTGRCFHCYINPNRNIDDEVVRVHGITNELVSNKPYFDEVVDLFMGFIEGAELVIHNATFDLKHLNKELSRLEPNSWGRIEDHCTVLDTLAMAKSLYPGKRNSLDALCSRLGINNESRHFHGALLDSEILASVYLMMSTSQEDLSIQSSIDESEQQNNQTVNVPIFQLTDQMIEAHNHYLQQMEAKGACIWLEKENAV